MSTTVTCRNCSTRLRVADNVSSRDVCPQCLTPLNDSESTPLDRAPNLARDIRRDRRATSWILWLLIGLAVVGVILATIQTYHAKGEEALGGLLCMMVLFGVLDVLVFIAGLGPLARLILRGPNATSFGRSIAFAVLMLAMAGAIFVFFFTACLVLAQVK